MFSVLKWDHFFEYPHHMFWFRNKKINFYLCALISMPCRNLYISGCLLNNISMIVINHFRTVPQTQFFLFVWFDSLLPINNLSVIKGRVFLGWTSTKLGLICLAQGHNAVRPVRLEPAAPSSWVKHSTTEPLCALNSKLWIVVFCILFPIAQICLCSHHL